MMAGPNNRSKTWRPALLAALAILPILLILLRPSWRHALVPVWVQRRAVLWFLWALLVGYGIVLILAIAGIVAGYRAIRREHRAGRPLPQRWLRVLFLSASVLVGLGLMELGAALNWYRVHRIPRFPVPFARGTEDAGDPKRDLYIVVLGESSAVGEPYDPWLSVGQILAWRLEEIFPGRRIELEMRARPGIHLQLALAELAGLERRPDAILLYSGHNEFQCRFSWSRSVHHYRGDSLLERGPLVELAARYSPLCRTIDETMEKHRLEFAPPSQITRDLVDVPACTPAEMRGIVADFRTRLDHFARYCDQIGAIPMAVIPPGNLVSYAPGRSVLDPGTTPEERAAFEADFRAAVALEAEHPERAIVAYGGLIARQPGFAEAHYRLGRLLMAGGEYQEADEHLRLALDLDGLPMRCPSPLQQAFREVAASRPSLLLVDGPALFRSLAPHGIVGDELVQDGQHPSLVGYAAIAGALLKGLAERHAFGLTNAPGESAVDPARCADHFGIDAAKWAVVCRRAALFYERTAYIRYDPSIGLAQAGRFESAAGAIEAGTPPEQAGVPGIGVPSEERVDERREAGAGGDDQQAEQRHHDDDRQEPPFLVLAQEHDQFRGEARLRPLAQLLESLAPGRLGLARHAPDAPIRSDQDWRK